MFTYDRSASIRRLVAISLFSICLSTGTTARADVPRYSLYAGLYLGGNFVLGGWALSSDPTIEPNYDHSFVGGARVGVHLFQYLQVEGNIGYLPARASGGTQQILEYGGALDFLLARGDWVPRFGVGGGVYDLFDGSESDDADSHWFVRLGLTGMIHDHVAFRVDLRNVFTDAIDIANNLELTVGFDFMLARTEDDRDDDGINDAVDKCPKTPGVASAGGCPDADGDGIKDSDDKCPKLAGVESAGGCPDADGDGIKDSADACPNIKGIEAMAGCPDSDGDGIRDQDDACPKVAGVSSLKGCPDADGDGIRDQDDACPKVAGPKATGGCPDKDGDGVPDKDDRCPEKPGLKAHKGCLPSVVKKFSGALEGIYFKTGSAKIKAQSFPVLDKVVEAFKEFPTLKVVIEGHTDDRGNDKRNLKLSQARADSVKEYLQGHGIAAERLTAIGYGEAKPVESNKTRKGRAANRRIEFKIDVR